MSFVFQPWQLFALSAVGAAEQDYQRAIEYLMAENRILKAKLGKKRILLTDDERRALAVKGKALGRKTLEQLATICTPDTMLRWRLELVAAKWNHSEKRTAPGRPKIAAEVVELVLQMAKENPGWGYDRIAGAFGQSWARAFRHDGRQHLESSRHRTGAPTKEDDQLEDVRQVALERARRRRFYDG